jgi:hypothetical protein
VLAWRKAQDYGRIDGSSPSAVEGPPPATAGCRALIDGEVLRCQEHFRLYAEEICLRIFRRSAF